MTRRARWFTAIGLICLAISGLAGYKAYVTVVSAPAPTAPGAGIDPSDIINMKLFHLQALGAEFSVLAFIMLVLAFVMFRVSGILGVFEEYDARASEASESSNQIPRHD